MRAAKFLKIRDRYLCPVQVGEELQRLNTREYVINKYYGEEENEKQKVKMEYLRDGVKQRFLLINVRFGTFAVATYDETPDPTPDKWNPDIERSKNNRLTNGEIFEKTKSDFDYADMVVHRLPPEWIVALKKTRFPVHAGTGLTAPEQRLHARMHILQRMQNDDGPLRADMSLFAQNLGYRVEANHPFIDQVHSNKYYEEFPYHQRN